MSDPVEGRFATVLVRITAIEPGVTKTLADVKQQVRDKLAGEKARIEIEKLHDEIDDGRSGGKTLQQIGEALKLKFVEIPETDRTNKTAAGAKALDTPDADTIVAAGFDAEVGVEREPVELPDGGFAWVDALTVTPPQQSSSTRSRPRWPNSTTRTSASA